MYQFFSKNERLIGTIPIAHIITASQLIELSKIVEHAVITITPPIVLLALHLLKLPFVLKISVKSNFDNKINKGFIYFDQELSH